MNQSFFDFRPEFISRRIDLYEAGIEDSVRWSEVNASPIVYSASGFGEAAISSNARRYENIAALQILLGDYAAAVKAFAEAADLYESVASPRALIMDTIALRDRRLDQGGLLDSLLSAWNEQVHAVHQRDGSVDPHQLSFKLETSTSAGVALWSSHLREPVHTLVIAALEQLERAASTLIVEDSLYVHAARDVLGGAGLSDELLRHTMMELAKMRDRRLERLRSDTYHWRVLVSPAAVVDTDLLALWCSALKPRNLRRDGDPLYNDDLALAAFQLRRAQFPPN